MALGVHMLRIFLEGSRRYPWTCSGFVLEGSVRFQKVSVDMVRIFSGRFWKVLEGSRRYPWNHPYACCSGRAKSESGVLGLCL